MLLAKEDLERLTESLIKKVVASGNDQMTMSESSASFAGGFTIEARPFKDNGNLKRSTGEVLKTTAMEMREMSEVLRELSTLIGSVVTEKRNLSQQLADERDFRA